ncbi:class I SAM-dependent methyltransferase [Nocardioides sp. SYSU D00065]|uniref:class I SAM-dependent methyltransferase n=1 Tax=Nocardioides sp. SYSU D00065 TaxID=2817378 RepID=UPI001B338539|nr:methyltransferase domain-containing protein [Nocardioides sp. SYSU D00065]
MGDDMGGTSEALRSFVEEAPVARGPHVTFLREALADLPAGARILDVGSGDSPYRELFGKFDYLTNDWGDTTYVPDVPVDVVAPAHDLPLADDALDAVVCTQVLEHTPEPWAVIDEFARVIRPGGKLILTAPLTWYLHEVPHDYYRFTAYGLRYLLDRAGFVDAEIRPMNDSAGTIAELLRHLRWILGTADDGRQPLRETSGVLVAELAAVVEQTRWLDTQWSMPISFSATARVPTAS